MLSNACNFKLLVIAFATLWLNTEISVLADDQDQDDRSFVIDYDQNKFLKDNKSFRYVSGSIHYFRSPEQRWNSLLRKMRLGGLNAITTYIPWNMHQPSPSLNFQYDGNLNVFKFLSLAQQNDLLVILRASPYIDAEWDMGGLPAWLLWEKPDIKLRSIDLEYNFFVSRWYEEILPRLKPFLYSNGGPVIMMQVENEYGSFGCDSNYTSFIRDLIRFHLGDDLVLFTTDGAGDQNVKCGEVPDVYPTVDFGPGSCSQIEKNFDIQRKHAKNGPLVNSEFYPGWLDHWQKPHSKTKSNVVANALTCILSLGANVNIYVFHGGTSFGYAAGANIDSGMYDPCPTSYDYDAPLTEAGDPTDKYFAIKTAISKYLPVPEEDPVVEPKAAYGKVALRHFTGIHDQEFLTIFSDRPHKSLITASPPSFEELKISSGFVLYQTVINFRTSDPALLSAPVLKDRAYIYVDKVLVGILSRSEESFSIPVAIRMGQTLSILVENQGRVCFGSEIGESKGLGQVTLGKRTLHNWTVFPLGEIDGKKLHKYSQGFKETESLNEHEDEDLFQSIRNKGSGRFFVGNFTLSKPKDELLDTFVRLDGYSRGFVWINGINLGRYWPVVGPQETLYLPGTFLKATPSTNSIIVFELEEAPNDCLIPEGYKESIGYGDTDNCFITLTDVHVIDAPTPYDGINTNQGPLLNTIEE